MQINGVNLIGYLYAEGGLGEASRLYLEALMSHSLPVSTVPEYSIDQRQMAQPVEVRHNHFLYDVNLFCLTIPHIPIFIYERGWKNFKKKYNIAIWYWETDVLNETEKAVLPYLDEIWAPSTYIYDNLRSQVSIPVHHIPNPLKKPIEKKTLTKSYFNLKEHYTFLFCFDFFSIVGRKNPLAVIRAFQKAFPLETDVQLILKSTNAHKHESQWKDFLQLIENDPRIQWMDGYLSCEERHGLMNVSDCYVSLHRSEGLGLTMAESMLLGKPVIATGFSGNVDFMNSDNSYLCEYEVINIGYGHEPYPPIGKWAQVNLEQAASYMRHVYHNRSEAQEKGRKARQDLLENFSCHKVGEQVSHRLRRITPRLKKKKIPLSYLKKTLQHSDLLRFFKKLID